MLYNTLKVYKFFTCSNGKKYKFKTDSSNKFIEDLSINTPI